MQHDQRLTYTISKLLKAWLHMLSLLMSSQVQENCSGIIYKLKHWNMAITRNNQNLISL